MADNVEKMKGVRVYCIADTVDRQSYQNTKRERFRFDVSFLFNRT